MGRTGGTSFVRAFGSAPRSSNTVINSKYGSRVTPFSNVALSTSMLRVSTAAHSGVPSYRAYGCVMRESYGTATAFVTVPVAPFASLTVSVTS